MIVGAGIAVAALFLGGVEYVESRIAVAGRVLSFECPDVDDDRRGDLVVVTAEQGKRSILLYRQTAGFGFGVEPDWRWTLPAEVVAAGFADVREDPGRELLLLSSGGLYSLSTSRASVRDNLRREIEAEVFPEIADPGALARFDWVVDLDGDGREEILLPTRDALLVFARRAANDPSSSDGASGFVLTDSIPLVAEVERPSGNIRLGIGSSAVETDERQLPRTMFPGAPTTFPLQESDRMLSQSVSLDAPRLIDFDGDGNVDAVRLSGPRIRVRRGLPGGRFKKTEDEAIDIAAQGGKLELHDMNGDGLPDVVVIDEDGDGLSREFVVKVFHNQGGGVVESEPSSLLKFQGSQVSFHFVDANGDGHLDLVATHLQLPTGLGSLTQVYLDTSVLLYLGSEREGLSRKADARFDRRLRPEQLQRILETFVLDMDGDYNGDGLKDLLSIRDDGLVQIRGLEASGDGVAFADQPMSVYQPSSPVRAVVPCWISRDKVSDLVLRHESGLTIFVSREDGR